MISHSSVQVLDGGQIGAVSGPVKGAMFAARKSLHTLATCGLALSCWNVRLFCWTKGTAWGCRISSFYWMTTKGVLNPWEFPPQTMTEPLPNLSLSPMQVLANVSPWPWPIQPEIIITIWEGYMPPLHHAEPSWHMCMQLIHLTST